MAAKATWVVGRALFVVLTAVAALVASSESVNEPLADAVGPADAGTRDPSETDAPEVGSSHAVSVEELRQYMDYYMNEFQLRLNRLAEKEWAFHTNVTDFNSAALARESSRFSAWQREEWASELSRFNLSADVLVNGSQELGRLFESVRVLGIPALADPQLQEWKQIVTNMTRTYGSATICPFHNQECDPSKDAVWSLDPDLGDIFSSSNGKEDFDELLYVWQKWRDASGRKLRGLFERYVNLTNEAAKANGYTDGGALWLHPYVMGSESGADKVKEDVEKLFQQLRPFYAELHAYVRHKLREHYGEDKVDPIGPIPAHLLGNMWAQRWQNIYPIVSEFNAPAMDTTPSMREQNYTVGKMVETSDRFFANLGLEGLGRGAPEFFDLSMLERPSDGREVICHASAWDFMATDNLPGDFRLQMCANVDTSDLVTTHHEMSHIQYYMQYVKQPVLFRNGANPAFHEAIGDALALSVATPRHMNKIGLLSTQQLVELGTEEAQLAFLLRSALDKVAFLPFAYMVDLYRWKVFDGTIPADKLNQEWWKLRFQYQGVEPPVPRSEEDFDAGSKLHVVDDTPYIRYFISRLLQFAFHQSLCEAAGQFDPKNPDLKPLHLCDIDGSAAAGAKVAKLMQAGSSKPWQEVLQQMTGSREMSAEPLLNYFKPLRDYLRGYVKKHDIYVGWISREEDQVAYAEAYLQGYNEQLRRMLNRYMEGDWLAATNISPDTENVGLDVQADFSDWEKKKWGEMKSLVNWQELPEGSTTRRQYESIAVLGTTALDDEKERERNRIIYDMTDIYSTARICPFSDPQCTSPSLAMDPDLEKIFENPKNRSYDELAYVWTAWRNATGKKVRGMFQRYAELSNEAARSNDHPDIRNYADLWLRPYEMANFTDEIARLWNETSDLYRNLHGYVRYRLRQFYADKRHEIPERGPIPAFLLGNMWSQDWTSIYEIVSEFENVPDFDVTDDLVKQNYDYRKMFATADKFFDRLGLTTLAEGAPQFFEKSMLVKPTDGRKVVCHGSAWDMYSDKDFRIKMCTDVTMDDLITIHHEMGHIQYQMQYSHQPTLFRDGANPGFHEAIGDVMSLSVSTPSHLRELGLLGEGSNWEDAGLAFLLRTALAKVAFLPFAYVVDAFRWAVFRNDTPEIRSDRWNRKWWQFREAFQGVKPAGNRSDDDLDPGSKYHVVADSSYIQYFVSYIIQFSIHEALCKATGHYDPEDPDSKLHECDISKGPNAKIAGDMLRKLMQSGSSRPWPEVLEDMTGSRQMSAQAILDYFRPLNEYLKRRLRETGAPTGWDSRMNEFFQSSGDEDDGSGSSAGQRKVVVIVVALFFAKVTVGIFVCVFVRRRRYQKQMTISHL